jgi:hypothetical protein
MNGLPIGMMMQRRQNARVAIPAGGGESGYTAASTWQNTGLWAPTGNVPRDDSARIPADVMSWAGTEIPGEFQLQTAVKRPGKSHALQITYPGTGTHVSREPNFNLGRRMGGEGQTIWVEWWMRVGGTFAPNAGTKKMFQMWNAAYTWSSTIGLSFITDPDGAVQLQQAITGSGIDAPGFTGTYYTGVFFTPTQTYPSGITRLVAPSSSVTPTIMALDTWHQIRVKVRWSSSFLALDGRFQVFVDGVLFQDSGNCNIHNNRDERNAGAPIGLQMGYIMGYANNGYTANSPWYWSDFSVSTINPGW